VIVVLAERDKEEMEMDIAKLEFDFMGTSVICRSGSPLILADLKKVHTDYLFFNVSNKVLHKDDLSYNKSLFKSSLIGFCFKGTGHYSFSS
jgi:hypothetical protein